MKYSLLAAVVSVAVLGLAACDETPASSDTTQAAQQETVLAEGTAQVGMPAIRNFRERKILKDIYELRDQNGLVTYTYLENMNPTPVAGKTALGGKLTFFCYSVGYPIPASTQFTNPQKIIRIISGLYMAITQAEPNGLFSPASAEGSWVMCKDPNGPNTKPMYSEPKLVGSPFKFPVD